LHQYFTVHREPWLTFLQNEYAQILAKRVAEAKAHKADARKRRASSMRK
jgi:hypothetical protein